MSSTQTPNPMRPQTNGSSVRVPFLSIQTPTDTHPYRYSRVARGPSPRREIVEVWATISCRVCIDPAFHYKKYDIDIKALRVPQPRRSFASTCRYSIPSGRLRPELNGYVRVFK